MGLNFEGSFDDISERQLDLIREVLVKRGYKNTNVKIDPVGVAGDNYVANVKRITVSDENETFRMIAKVAPQNEAMRMMMNTHMLFKNEHIMYTKVLPKFQELQTNAEVPDKDRLRFAACYGSLLEQPNELILLEDLKTSNFVMLDRFKSLSNECVKSVLKDLAILHSLSYVLKRKEPAIFKALKSDFFDMWASMTVLPELLIHFTKQEKDYESIIENEEQKRVMRNAITNSLNLIAKFSQSEIDCKHSVILQGDSWINNIMFQFDGDILQQSIMIDYQISKESNPTRDIQYMIFNCTDHETRLKHFHDWIDYYHSELDRSLSNFGLRASYVYSRDQLDADMRTYAKIVFGLSLLLAGALTMQSEEAMKFKEMIESTGVNKPIESLKISDFDPNYIKLLKSRIEGLVDSYLAFGLL